MKRLLIALALLLLLSTYNLQNHLNINSKLQIKKITIENNQILEEKKILLKLDFLYGENLFLLNTKNIQKNLREIDFIESFEIKKKYPNQIIIKIFEKIPIAIIQNKKKKNFFSSKGDLIKFDDLSLYKNLPLVFGDEESFKIFYDNLKKINFPIHSIKSFFLFESKRWDLLTQKNQTIKLPIKNYNSSLKNFLNLEGQANFEKFKIFDYRIIGQLILK